MTLSQELVKQNKVWLLGKFFLGDKEFYRKWSGEGSKSGHSKRQRNPRIALGSFSLLPSCEENDENTFLVWLNLTCDLKTTVGLFLPKTS